jgi:hypothetical protein
MFGRKDLLSSVSFYERLADSELRARALSICCLDDAAQKVLLTAMDHRGLSLVSCVPTGVRPRSNPSAAYHAWVLRKIQQIRRKRRKLLRNRPWLSDLLGLVGYLSLFDMVATASAIFFEPDHLLWKAPVILGKTNSLYARPIRYLALCGGAVTATFSLFHVTGYGSWTMLAILALISFGSLIWVPGFLFCAAAVQAVFLQRIPLEPMFPGVFRIDSYTRIWNSSLLWIPLYFGTSLYLACGTLMAVSLIFAAIIGLIGEFFGIDSVVSRALVGFVMIPAAGAFVVAARSGIYRPYFAVLLAASSRPSPTMLRLLAGDLGKVLAHIDESRGTGWHQEDEAVIAILREWGYLRRAFRYQEWHATRCGPKTLERLLQDRASVFGSAMPPLRTILSPFGGHRLIDRLVEEAARVEQRRPISAPQALQTA